MATKKSKKEPIELPDDPISWREITTYSRGNPWIRIPTDEMFAEGGSLVPFRYGDKKLIVRYDKYYVFNWFSHYLESLNRTNCETIVQFLLDCLCPLDIDESNPDKSPFKDDESSEVPISPHFPNFKDGGDDEDPIDYDSLDEDDDNNRGDRDDDDTIRSLSKSIILGNSNYLDTEGSGLNQLDDEDDFSDLSSDDDELFDTPLVAQDDQDIDYSELKAQGEYDDSYQNP